MSMTLGLIFDGDNRGRYTGEAVQAMAIDHGFTGRWVNADHDHYDDAITEAEEYLNKVVAHPECLFHFVNGSFFYEKLEWLGDHCK